MTDKALAERLRKLAQAYRSVVVVDVTSINEATDLDRAADLIEQMAQAKPSRSERLREAGFTPRDKRIACDECGQLVSQQFLPIHKCEQRGEPVAWLRCNAMQWRKPGPVTAEHPLECLIVVPALRQADGDWWIEGSKFLADDAPIAWCADTSIARAALAQYGIKEQSDE